MTSMSIENQMQSSKWWKCSTLVLQTQLRNLFWIISPSKSVTSEFLIVQWLLLWGSTVKWCIISFTLDPQKNLECQVQKCGRVGQDSEHSKCVLLHNGLMAAHCSNDVKNYIEYVKECRI